MWYKSLREALVSARARHKHSQEAAAAEIHVSVSTLRNWEQTDTKPNVDSYEDLAKYLKMEVVELYRFLNPEEVQTATSEIPKETP